MRKKYNTPHRSRVVKTRLSEDEYADFTARLAPYGISQSEFLRQAIRRTTIRPVIHQVLRYYEGYINKLCTRTLYDPDGQPHVRVDEYMKRRLEVKLIHSIVSMS